MGSSLSEDLPEDQQTAHGTSIPKCCACSAWTKALTLKQEAKVIWQRPHRTHLSLFQRYFASKDYDLDLWPSRSSKVRSDSVNRKPMGGFLSYRSSIESNIVSLTVFKIFEHQCSYTLQWAGLPSSPLARPSHGDPGPHLIQCVLGPHESLSQTASRSVQPFLHSSSAWQTDRPRYWIICRKRPHYIMQFVHSMRPNNTFWCSSLKETNQLNDGIWNFYV